LHYHALCYSLRIGLDLVEHHMSKRSNVSIASDTEIGSSCSMFQVLRDVVDSGVVATGLHFPGSCPRALYVPVNIAWNTGDVYNMICNIWTVNYRITRLAKE
jgi:hypothetical protein